VGHDDQFDAAAGAFNHLSEQKGPMVISDALIANLRSLGRRR
jgi:hypothetical protein